ncbi:MAG: hypothetical protein QW351_09015, partial [Candidatus Caldarchaeum sp.]
GLCLCFADVFPCVVAGRPIHPTPSPPGWDGLRASTHHGTIAPVITKSFNKHGYKQIDDVSHAVPTTL